MIIEIFSNFGILYVLTFRKAGLIGCIIMDNIKIMFEHMSELILFNGRLLITLLYELVDNRMIFNSCH